MSLRLPILLPVTLGLALLAGPAHAAAPKPKERGLEVLVSADAIPSQEGFRPKPGKPIHYLFTQTRQSLGEPIAGVKLPPPEFVEQTVVAELAKQGFVRTAERGNPSPQIIIVAAVGDANFEEPPFDDRHPDQDPDFRQYLDMVNLRPIVQRNLIGTLDMPGLGEIFSDEQQPRTLDVIQIRNEVLAEALRIREKGSPRAKDRPVIQSLIGGNKIAHAVDTHAMTEAEAQRIVATTRDNTFFICLQAYDLAHWAKKERFLLWRTTLIVDWRKDLTKELPALLARAGPVFGTDTLPEFLDTRDQRKGEVEIGELKVVPEKEKAAVPKGEKK